MPHGRKKLAKTLSGQALFAAKLLAGEMPQDIEEAFRDAGLSLFPEKLRDLVTDCSCPDWSNPCKHIAAVYSTCSARSSTATRSWSSSCGE